MGFDLDEKDKAKLLELTAGLLADKLVNSLVNSGFTYRIEEQVRRDLFDKLVLDPTFNERAAREYVKIYDFKLAPLCERAIKPAVAALVAKEIGGKVAELGNEFAERVLVPFKEHR